MPDVTALSMTDVQPKVGPALSATSDVPEVKAPPPPVSEEVNTKAVETKTEETPAKVETKPEGEKPEGDKPENTDEPDINSDETPAWMKARITKESNKRRAAETARAAAEAKADALNVNLTKALESIDSLTKAQAKQIAAQAEKEDPRPVRETFDDPAAYDAALIDWASRRAALVAKTEAEKTVSDKLAADKAEADKKAQAVANQKVADEFAARKAKFMEDHPDYEELAESEDLQISVPMAAAILNDEDGPAIAYYLGQNPDEAERISKITSGPKQIAELGRIAQRLAYKPATPTKPAPIRPLKAGSETAVTKSPSEMSMEEYGAMRNRKLANERRERMGLAPLN